MVINSREKVEEEGELEKCFGLEDRSGKDSIKW